MLFAVKYLNIYQTNSSVHGVNTRQQNKLHIPSVKRSSIQRGVYYSTVKILNQLPQNILKFCNNIHNFKTLLRDYCTRGWYIRLIFVCWFNNKVDFNFSGSCYIKYFNTFTKLELIIIMNFCCTVLTYCT